MLFSESVSGMVRIRITCADIENCLSKLITEDFLLRDVNCISDLSAELSVNRSYLPHITNNVEKMGGEIKLLRRVGLYWWLKSVKKRPVLLVGVAL